VANPTGGAGDPPASEQPSKKRRKERAIAGDGGTTSAAAGAAPEPVDDLASPLSPSYDAVPGASRRAGDHLMEAVVKVCSRPAWAGASLRSIITAVSCITA
jgi:hypothetical protein